MNPSAEQVAPGLPDAPASSASGPSPFDGKGQANIASIDLVKDNRMVGNMPGLEIICERFAKSFRRTLSTVLKQSCEIEVVSTEVITFSDFILQVPRPTGLFVFELPPLPGGCAVVVDGHLLLAIVDAYCGGPEQDLSAGDGSVDRDLTAIELRLLSRLAQPMLHDVTEAWKAVTTVRPRFARTVVRPELSGLADEPESVIFAVFEAHIGGYRSPIALLLPMATLEPIRERLMRVSHVPGHVRSSQPGQQLVEHLPNVELDVSVELGRTHVDVRTLLSWKVGDVVRLDTSAESSLLATIEGKPKFMGTPEASGSALRFRVQKKITDP